MEMPSVIHPIKFNIGGFLLEVRSFEPLNDRQAEWVVRYYCRNHKLKKKDIKKLHVAITTASPNQIDNWIKLGEELSEQIRGFFR
jgi:hypothetical protein